MSRNIIGLDLSLTNTGVVILDEDGKPRINITITTKKLRGVERLYFIKQEIKKILRYYKPGLAVIEGYAMGVGKGRFGGVYGRTFSIGELGGVVKLLLYILGINYLIVAPKTLKKFAALNGNADKEKMKKVIEREWKVKFNTEHEYDAFGLAMLGYSAYRVLRKEMTVKEKQQEAIDTVMKDESKRNYIKGGNNDK